MTAHSASSPIATRGAGVCESVGVGSGLDDVPAEFFSSRSVRTWKSISAPRRSSSM